MQAVAIQHFAALHAGYAKSPSGNAPPPYCREMALERADFSGLLNRPSQGKAQGRSVMAHPKGRAGLRTAPCLMRRHPLSPGGPELGQASVDSG